MTDEEREALKAKLGFTEARRLEWEEYMKNVRLAEGELFSNENEFAGVAGPVQLDEALSAEELRQRLQRRIENKAMGLLFAFTALFLGMLWLSWGLLTDWGESENEDSIRSASIVGSVTVAVILAVFAGSIHWLRGWVIQNLNAGLDIFPLVKRTLAGLTVFIPGFLLGQCTHGLKLFSGSWLIVFYCTWVGVMCVHSGVKWDRQL